MPVTHMLRADNMDVLAREKRDFVFKPLHGFAGRGLIDSAAVGRARLRRLLKVSDGYVAQKRIAKPSSKSMEYAFGTIFVHGHIGARSSSFQGAPQGGRTGLI